MSAASPTALATRAVFNETGAASLSLDEVHLSMRLGAYGPTWSYAGQDDATDVVASAVTQDSRTYSGTFPIQGTSDGELQYFQQAALLPGGALSIQWDTTLTGPTTDVEINSLNLSLYLEVTDFAGVTITTDAGPFVLPEAHDGAAFQQWTTTSLSFPLGDSGEQLDLTLPQGATLHFQDNRAWSGSEYELRFIVRAAGTYPSPTPDTLAMEVATTDPLEVLLEPELEAHDTAGWTQFQAAWNIAPTEGSAVDVHTALGAPGVPGANIQAAEGHFLDPENPGEPLRFFGWNFTSSANFPEHAEAEIIAERISRLGVNLVRHHHMDAPWSNPSLLDYAGDCRTLNPEALDRFHYLVAQLRAHGISSYVDLLVHREACDGMGIDAWDSLPLGWKGYALVDPTLLALQQEYASDLLTTVNPYTGLSLAEDPGVVLVELVNENDLYASEPTLEPYASHLDQSWQNWLAAEGLPPTESKEGDVYRRFLSGIQADFYQQMATFLRGLGVTIPIAGTNWGTRPALLAANGTLDFTDSHAYWNHPFDDYTRFANQPMVQTDLEVSSTTLGTLAFSAIPGRPNFISEWGHPWPNFTRAEGPLWMAATASLQGWDGLAHYTYRHRSGEVGALEGAFDGVIDPAVYALFPAAALMYRRGDVEEATLRTLVEVNPFGSSPPKTAWTTSVGQRRTRTLLPGVSGIPTVTLEDDDLQLAPDASALSPDGTAQDAQGQLHHAPGAGLVRIDTPRTQGALGMLGGAREQVLGDVSITVTDATPFAVVVVSSLSEVPIAKASRLLVTAVAQVENTGQTAYRDTSWIRGEFGEAPILVEPVQGEIVFGRSLDHATAWRLDPLGDRVQEVSLDGGTLALAEGGFSPWMELVFPAAEDTQAETGNGDTGRDSGASREEDSGDGRCGCANRSASPAGASWLAGLLFLGARRRQCSKRNE